MRTRALVFLPAALTLSALASGCEKAPPAAVVSPAIGAPTLPFSLPPRPNDDERVGAAIDFHFDGNTIVRGLQKSDSGIGESFGASGLGLSGIGEGAGGRGEGLGLGGMGSLGHGHGARRSSPPGSSVTAIRSGEWDDNANYVAFQNYLGTLTAGAPRANVADRRVLVVRDVDGKPVPNCAVTVIGRHGEASAGSVELTTTASGRALFFPRSELPGADTFHLGARCVGGDSSEVGFTLADEEKAIRLDLSVPRTLGAVRSVDVVFALDTTGSMQEEIDALRKTIEKVAETLGKQHVAVRFGLVEYKDRVDPFVTRVHPMTRDLDGFVGDVARVRAFGGGDIPEDVNAGLETTLSEINFDSGAVARMVFVIGDAPPHLDYPGEDSYLESAKKASHRGIVLHTIAASGMDHLGQAAFREIAAYTGGTAMFILRGGAGPESVGGGDPISACGGTETRFTTGNLDGLITRKVSEAIQSVDGDPMRIAGLDGDERAKKCGQRPPP